MQIIDILMITGIVAIEIAIFFSGLFLGRIMCISNIQEDRSIPHKFQKNKPLLTSIDIDESKVVTSIRTDNLEKKFDKIAETKETKADISASINKLKSMKG
jgi:hypothetical protein